MSNVEHKIVLKYDERYLARPWGVLCSCGFNGAATTEREAQVTKLWHEQVEKAKEQQAREGTKYEAI